MAAWFQERIVETGRLPLFGFFAGLVVGFLVIRFSVRMIRAGVRWWPGNITRDGVHVHHAVFGVGFMLLGGVAGLAVPDELVGWRSAAAVCFGVGAALVLDEFALILHLADVYWSEQGRSSVDALVAVVGVTAMLLLGLQPFLVQDARLIDSGDPRAWPAAAAPLLISLGLAAVTVLKGKIWTGLVGLFVPVLLALGAVRLARPGSPWARWRYHPDRPEGARKLARTSRRERRWREPVSRFKDRLEDLVAGRPDGS